MAKRQRLGVHRRADTPVCSTDRLAAGDHPGTQPAEQRHGRELREDHQASYVAHMPKPDRETALRNLAIAFEHYNEQHPHSALNYRSPREFRRLAVASI